MIRSVATNFDKTQSVKLLDFFGRHSDVAVIVNAGLGGFRVVGAFGKLILYAWLPCPINPYGFGKMALGFFSPSRYLPSETFVILSIL